MNRREIVEAELEAIYQVRKEAAQALAENNLIRLNELMGNLAALERCLTADVKSLLEELKQKKIA